MDNRKEPPFFNDDNMGPFYCRLHFCDTMELFIETLTGTCFELRVSPFETVISVKAKIRRLEDPGDPTEVSGWPSPVTTSAHSVMTLEAFVYLK
ncbi:ZFAND4 isoform 7 [Pan troglodytes]|uniref:ZFAND4 isoform 7 n=1 Tax=Pan troglodytes TaxID=9598 RepID=A0A2J8IP63_PANTR|nr:ZFAND4 isoform 7 [Pan troglodytes]